MIRLTTYAERVGVPASDGSPAFASVRPFLASYVSQEVQSLHSIRLMTPAFAGQSLEARKLYVAAAIAAGRVAGEHAPLLEAAGWRILNGERERERVRAPHSGRRGFREVEASQ
jgi:hypothetical protein